MIPVQVWSDPVLISSPNMDQCEVPFCEICRLTARVRKRKLKFMQPGPLLLLLEHQFARHSGILFVMQCSTSSVSCVSRLLRQSSTSNALSSSAKFYTARAQKWRGFCVPFHPFSGSWSLHFTKTAQGGATTFPVVRIIMFGRKNAKLLQARHFFPT